MENIKISFFNNSPVSIDLIRNTWEKAFNRDFNQKYWEWRFLKNPQEKYPNIVYIKINDTVASYYAISEVKLVVEDKIKRGGLMNMGMTHPDYFGKGFFSRIEQELHKKLFNDGFDFLYGFANHNSHRVLRKHGGWTDLFVLNNFNGTSERILNNIPDSNENYKFTDVEASIKDLDLFENLIYTNSSIYFDRDNKFIKWRFIDHPFNQYYFLKIYEKDQLAGIIIYKKYLNGVDLMETFCSPGRNSLEILRNGLFYLSRKSTNISIWSNLHSEEHIFLESLGFIEKDFNTYFGYISSKGNMNIDSKKVHFRFTDSDVY